MNYLLTETQIDSAIKKAEKGIYQYLEIQNLLFEVNVETDKKFQKLFNGFYKVRQRNKKWYEVFYKYMERAKNKDSISFDETLLYFKEQLNRCEPSFSSKLIATIIPEMPIWDTYVLKNCGITPASYSDKNKCIENIKNYQKLITWYDEYLKTNEAKLILKLFDQRINNEYDISKTKKIDFVLWQTR